MASREMNQATGQRGLGRMTGQNPQYRRRQQIGQRQGQGTERLANVLGWFSIGLGLAQIAAPEGLSRMIGIKPNGRTNASMRMLGLREMSAGIGLLAQPRPRDWAWARVAGDAMDIALLGNASRDEDNDRRRISFATTAVLAVTALDVVAAQRLTQARRQSSPMSDGQGGTVTARKSITINRPASEVYGYWHNFENLPRFMNHLESVQTLGDGRSHWRAKAPAGTSVEWDAITTEDRPNELIAWRSVEGSDVDNSGVVRFVQAPGGRGTEVHVDLTYDPPAGKVGALFAKLFGEEPNQQIAEDLRRFKQVLETGEVVYSDSSIHEGMYPAQPPRERQHLRGDSERELVVERAADAAESSSSNRERGGTRARGRQSELRQ